jgi:hypothetical protein
MLANPKRRRSLWRTRRRWEDNIKMDFIRRILVEIVD